MSIIGWGGDWPPAAGTAIGKYDFLIRPFLAVQEKFKLIGATWPPPHCIWDSGPITGAVDNGDGTITLSMAVTPIWTVVGNPCYADYQPRWVAFVPTAGGGCKCPPCWIPTSYDLVVQLDARDTRTVVRGHVVAQTVSGTNGTLTILAAGVLNAVTAKFIPAVSSLIGGTYNLLKQGGPYIGDRLPDTPNDPERWNDTATVDSGTRAPATGDATNYTRVKRSVKFAEPWADEQWTAKELLIFAGPLLKRIVISHNDRDTVYVPYDATISGGGVFSIVDVGTKAMPGRVEWHWDQWYYGNSLPSAAHTPDDALSVARVPLLSAKWTEGASCPPPAVCDDHETGHPAFELDIIYPGFTTVGYPTFGSDTETATCNCGRAGDLVNPNLTKSFRQLQRLVDGNPNAPPVLQFALCSSFIQKGYAGGYYPWTYTTARLLHAAGINAGTSSLYWNTDHHEFTVAGQYAGKMIYWTVIESNQKERTSGYTAASSSGVVTVNGLSHNGGVAPTDDGKTVVYSAGRTRYRPRWFKYLFPKTSFIPDPKPPLMGGGVYDPPSVGVDLNGHYDCGGKGTWVRKDKSAGGVLVSDDGAVYDSIEPFVVGEVYRYIGDNFGDPFPGGDASSDPIVPYDDKFYRGRLNPTNQTARDVSRAGKATAGTKYSLTQAAYNWWADWANTGGTLRIESGTATGGTATTLKDSTKDTTNPALPHSCWWDNAGNPRYPAATAFGDFILEVDKTVLGVTTTYKMPILSTANGATGVTVNFAAVAGFSVAAGDVYRIREPKYELNKWEGRKLTMTKPDGTVYTRTITHSDDRTLYFAPIAEAVDLDWTFQIEEPGFGGIFKWTGTGMVQATGPDVSRTLVATPYPFHSNPNENREGFVKDFGVVHYGDLMDGPTLYNELYDTLNLLRDRKFDFGWVSRADPAVPEQNLGGSGSGGTAEAGFEQGWFPADDDKSMADAAGRNPYNRPVITKTGWDEFYAIFAQNAIDNGVYQTEQSPSVYPYRAYNIGGTLIAYHGYDPSGNYPNQPWMELEQDVDGPTAASAYAYGLATGIPEPFPISSADFLVYCTVDAADHDEGHIPVVTSPGYGGLTQETEDEAFIFDAGTSPAVYRTWVVFDTQAVVSGKAMSVKFNDNEPNATFPMELEYPYGIPAELVSLDHTLGTNYFWHVGEIKGFWVKDKALVVRYVLEFMA